MSFKENLKRWRWEFFQRRSNFLAILEKINPSFIFEGIYHQQITGLLPVIGYALALASVGDYIYLIFPPQFKNPTWELQTLGALVDLGALVEQSWGFNCPRLNFQSLLYR